MYYHDDEPNHNDLVCYIVAADRTIEFNLSYFLCTKLLCENLESNKRPRKHNLTQILYGTTKTNFQSHSKGPFFGGRLPQNRFRFLNLISANNDEFFCKYLKIINFYSCYVSLELLAQAVRVYLPQVLFKLFVVLTC